MPELPEVEFARTMAHRITVGLRIIAAEVADDPIVFDGTAPEALQEALVGRQVTGTGRRGKYLWLTLEGNRSVLCHLGMTGALRTPNEAAFDYQTGPPTDDTQWPPRFTKLRLLLEGGAELAITNARRLGRIWISDDPLAHPRVTKLGFDPLTDPPSLTDFAAAVGRRRSTLKGLLLDQRFAAGVGNWIADEVLFQAGLAPHRKCDTLRDDELRALYQALVEVIAFAVKVDADKGRFPPHWLFHHRWGRDRAARTSDGEPIRFDTVAGRTTAWVPSRQR